MSAEGVTLSGVLWNTKLCTDTTLESPIQLGAEGAKMADRAIPISQAKGQGWHWVTPIVYVDAYMHTTAGPSHIRLECGGFVVRRKGMSKPPVKLGVDKSHLIEKERTS